MTTWILNEHLPPECSLAILAAACQGEAADRITLKALRELCRAAYSFMKKHKTVIIELYTVSKHEVSVTRDSATYYMFCGVLHRNDGLPAVEYNDGYRGSWYWMGQLHRDDDLPAIVGDGWCAYFKCGQQHRDNDLPAWVSADGSMQWYIEDKLHRDGDMPADVDSDGRYSWWQHGLLHRGNWQPAVVHADGRTEYYHRGKRYYNTLSPVMVDRSEGTIRLLVYGLPVCSIPAAIFIVVPPLIFMGLTFGFFGCTIGYDVGSRIINALGRA